ncbi:peroxiredoxin [Govanella unica]|uniref:thioredoxin-dependent peroxiredoxin n=1 Tax=Govanella unica TaxID=2975056 RepID=A0A9X3TYP9_9PROT|nr:peroxiredoxin [Govania unica]MDA5193837.1 peroxiredoxin [Govania unica]
MKALPIILSAALIFASAPAMAALKIGDKAPDFSTEATLGGKEFTFVLKEALARGPVVLYFFPAAFTPGCTAEAHEFAEASDNFKALGATVIGVSADEIAKLNKFSISECRNKFAVAADPEQKVIKAYDAVLLRKPAYADRVSYVISPEGRVIFTHSGMDPLPHVENSLKAVRDWAAAHPAAKPVKKQP